MAPKVALRIALMPTREEGRKGGLPERVGERRKKSEIRSKSIKADFARKVEWTTTRGFWSDAARFERSNGCKSDFGKLAARRSLKYIKLNLSACK